MAEPTWRKSAMVRLIPRFPRKITVAELQRLLAAEGYPTTRRTIERDLHEVSRKCEVACDEGGRPVGWYWRKERIDPFGPGLSIGEALQLELVDRHLRPLLPAAVVSVVESRLREARATLRTLAPAPLARWRERVAVVAEGPPLRMPMVPPGITEAVHDALIRCKRMNLVYRSLGGGRGRPMQVHPLAIVYQGGVGYLVALVWDYDDPRHLALHRIRSASVADEPAREPENFDLQRHLVEEAQFDLPSGRSLRLELRVDDWLAAHLLERPLSDDQQATSGKGGSGRCRIQATVIESERLVWWLRSHGGSVEVLRPVALRRRLAAEFKELAARYHRD